MYVRLAFAVAAHLEPEILIVDEVLAVGDAAFQKKCLGKMGEVASEGRTVLFVSHNMAAIRSLRSARSGSSAAGSSSGPTSEVVSRTSPPPTSRSEAAWSSSPPRSFLMRGLEQTARNVSFDSLALLGEDGRPTAHVPELTPLRFDIGLRVREPIRFLEIALRVKTGEGSRIFSCYSGQRDMELDAEATSPGA